MKRMAVLGDPVAHSASPRMHEAAYRALGLPHRYEAKRVSVEQLPQAVAELRAGDYAGFNVTLPHKQRVLELVDEWQPLVRLASSANTLVRSRKGRIVAHNTDIPALAQELGELAGRRQIRRAVVLGAGGAARGAVLALSLILRVPHVIVRARVAEDLSRARALQAELEKGLPEATRLEVAPFVASAALERNVCLIVQATSLGMQGGGDGQLAARAVAWSECSAGTLAYDLVYTPAETPFTAAARAHGLRVKSGLGMLVRQGALAFELWFGMPAPYHVMHNAIAP